MLQITSELKRVLKPTGTMWWNHGQTYSGSGQGAQTGYADKKRERVEGNLEASITKNTGITEKCMMMLPERLALRMVDEQDWIVRNDIVWFKPNHMPSSVKDRLATSWEHIYLFVKNKRYFFNLDAIREVQAFPSDVTRRIQQDKLANVNQFAKGSQNARHSVNLRVRDLQAGRIKGLEWKIHCDGSELGKYYKGKLIETNFESSRSLRARELRIKYAGEEDYNGLLGHSGYTDSEGNPIGNVLGKNPGDVWRITTKPYKEAHFATFPPDLPERCIKAGCPNEVCSKCGKPKVPISEPTGEYAKIIEANKTNGNNSADWFPRADNQIKSGKEERVSSSYRMIGYQATCSCNSDFVAGTVLDPFAGSGTTLSVAIKLDVNAVGIEINLKYVEMIKRRCNIPNLKVDFELVEDSRSTLTMN